MKKIAIIGGGAVGIFVAANLSDCSDEITIHVYEKGKRLLEKVRISGGGRCNVTHDHLVPMELIKNYPRGGKSLLGPFSRFNCLDTYYWFVERGVELKTEEDGRVFPTSDNSETIIECLMGALSKKNLSIFTSTAIRSFEHTEGRFVLEDSNGLMNVYDAVVVATGSGKQGYQLLENMNLELRPLLPSLFTFQLEEEWVKTLSGISINNVSLRIEGEKIKSQGVLLFTHWGISGPAVLKLSAFAAQEFFEKDYNTNIEINWLSLWNEEEIKAEILNTRSNNIKKLIKNTPLFELPSRFWAAILEQLDIHELKWADISNAKINLLMKQLIASVFKMLGKSTNKEEFVTCGGLDLNEINLKTFSTKKIPNLYVAGEALNVDAITGGFNFQAAWTGGWHIAEDIKRKVKEDAF